MNQNQIVHVRGDSGTFEVTLTDSAGDPLDLTGASVDFTVGDLIEKSLGDGVAVATPVSGVAVITLDPEDTEDASDYRRAYRYDVQVTLADGTVRTPIRGLFVLVPDVTTP